MLFTRIAFSVTTLSPILGVFAGHHSSRGFNANPHSDHHGQASRQVVESGVAILSTAQRELDACKSQIGTVPILDLAMANTFLSCVGNVSNSAAADMGTLHAEISTFLVDSGGNKLTNEQAAENVLALVEGFGSACSSVKSVANGDTGDMIQVITVNIESIQGDLARVAPNVSGLPGVVKGFKTCQNLLDAMIEDIMGPEGKED